MWKRLCVVGIAVVSLACASSKVWTKRGITPGEVTNAHFYCEMQSRKYSDAGYAMTPGSGGAGPAFIGLYAADKSFQNCMRALGFEIEGEPADGGPDVAARASAAGIGTGIEYEPPPGFCSADLVERSRFTISKTDPERREAFVEPDLWDAVDDEARVTLAVWVSNCLFDGKSVTLRHGTTGRYIGLYSWKTGFLPISVGSRTAPPDVEP